MNSNANKEIAVNFTVDNEDIRLTQGIVSEYLAGGAQITMPEFKLFTSLCKARGLNPFLKEAYIIKYGSAPAQIVVGKDAILKRAILNPDFNGREQGIIVVNEHNETTEKNGTFMLESETLVGGWAKVYRKNWDYPVYVTVGFSEVAQKKRDGSLNSQWASKGATMVEKVALVRALREAFVENAGGMYDADELSANDSIIDVEPTQVITPQNDTLESVEAVATTDDNNVINIADL